jgi:hypothetical protein
MGAADRDHRDALRREVAAPADGERLDRDPVALASTRTTAFTATCSRLCSLALTAA